MCPKAPVRTTTAKAKWHKGLRFWWPCPGWLRLTWPHAYCLMSAGPGTPDTIGPGSSGGWRRPRSGPGTLSPAAGAPRWEGKQAQTSGNEWPDWRIPHGQSGSEPQKETGESHRRRSTHHGVAEVAARKWLSSWPPATVGTGICSSPYQECLLRYAPGLIEWSLLVSTTTPNSIKREE